MNTIRQLMFLAIIEQAINNLVDKKYQLDQDFANGLINYAEYEEHKSRIQSALDALSQ